MSKYDWLKKIGSNVAVSASEANHGSASLKHDSRNGYGVGISVPDYGTYILGFAFYIDATGHPTQERKVAEMGYRFGTHCDIRLTTLSKLTVTRNGTPLATTNALTWKTWYYVEWKLVVHNTAGVMQLHIHSNEGAVLFEQIDLTNQDTQNASEPLIDLVVLGSFGTTSGTNGTNGWYYDDVFIFDDQGTGQKDTVDNAIVEALFPTGVGFLGENFAVYGSGANWSAVDEDPPDDDTTYIYDSTLGQKETFTFGNLMTAVGEVQAVVLNVRSKKLQPGRKQIAAVALYDSVDSIYDSVIVNADYYIDQMNVVTKPDGTQWNIETVNDAEFGVKIVE